MGFPRFVTQLILENNFVVNGDEAYLIFSIIIFMWVNVNVLRNVLAF